MMHYKKYHQILLYKEQHTIMVLQLILLIILHLLLDLWMLDKRFKLLLMMMYKLAEVELKFIINLIGRKLMQEKL